MNRGRHRKKRTSASVIREIKAAINNTNWSTYQETRISSTCIHCEINIETGSTRHVCVSNRWIGESWDYEAIIKKLHYDITDNVIKNKYKISVRLSRGDYQNVIYKLILLYGWIKGLHQKNLTRTMGTCITERKKDTGICKLRVSKLT